MFVVNDGVGTKWLEDVEVIGDVIDNLKEFVEVVEVVMKSADQ